MDKIIQIFGANSDYLYDIRSLIVLIFISILSISARDEWDKKIRLNRKKILLGSIFLSMIVHFATGSYIPTVIAKITIAFLSYGMPEIMGDWKDRKVWKLFDFTRKLERKDDDDVKKV